jgi:dipeptidyl aminopeptidase/acylaminoacyl peptidase
MSKNPRLFTGHPSSTSMRRAVVLALLVLLSSAGVALAQGVEDRYARSGEIPALLRDKVDNLVDGVTWGNGGDQFWYRRTVPGGHEFVVVEVATLHKGPAFDHGRLATALSTATGETYEARTLPFAAFQYVEGGAAVEFRAANAAWRCTVTEYGCTRTGAATGPGQFGQRPAGAPVPGGAAAAEVVTSPDGRLEASIRNFNVAVRPVGAPDSTWRILGTDGSEGDAYRLRSIAWSPDSRKVAAYRTQPGYRRIVRFIISSPETQLQPDYMERVYAKPGDVLDVNRPVIFHVDMGRQVVIDDALFPNAYQMMPLQWREDSRRLTFEYNQRGHQTYRVIEVDAETGSARALISEQPETFFAYRDLNASFRDHGTRFRHDVRDGEEIIWASERDGWRHLYRIDGRTGRVRNPVTRGEWAVNQVDHVDDEKGEIWFRANGMVREQDPYFVHYYRIGFDGRGLTAFTTEDGTHTVTWSPDREYYVDQWSRVDLPTVTVLKRASDQSVVMELERGDATRLLATGWRYPEVFVAKGRDGRTDIWGIIVRPVSFDPSQQYAVIESIYAGPQGSFVPKTFGTLSDMYATAELGFILVQIDGMGTNNRSKAFHDVAWQNLGDAGFPDRILWHRAAAERYAYYDISRVGVYGGSAGGQNSLGALLFHPDFYHVAVSSVGSHDNRMDKIWWNEQYMGWPLGPHYSAASNVDNAWRLQGELLLIVGELDTNVDPSSTMQVVDRLIKAQKHFDFLYIPGAGHGSGGAYGTAKRNDFFVRHLLGTDPPRRNRVLSADEVAQARAGQQDAH